MADPPKENLPRPLSELRDTGLLWLINRVVFHPRGWALALHTDEDDAIIGWSLEGDGAEPWIFSEFMEQQKFAAAEETLRPLPR
jgi:hypothetical protein